MVFVNKAISWSKVFGGRAYNTLVLT